MMFNRWKVAAVALIFWGGAAGVSQAQEVPDTLWLQLDEAILAGDTMPALRFCEQAAWDSLNYSFHMAADAPQNLVVHNGDTVDHAFTLNAEGWEPVALPAGEATELMLPALPTQLFSEMDGVHFLDDGSSVPIWGYGWVTDGYITLPDPLHRGSLTLRFHLARYGKTALNGVAWLKLPRR